MSTPPDASAHGGNIYELSIRSGIAPEDILDFSVNVRPAGMPDFLRGAVLCSLDQAAAYPSPHAEEACAAASARLGIPADSILFGNGSNELIHALPRALQPTEALIVQPAFTEYELACSRAGIPVRHTCTSPEDGFLPDPIRLIPLAPKGGCIFIANPGNPSGALIPRHHLLQAAELTPGTCWIIDEAFIDFAGEEHSLVTHAPSLPNLIVLRSLTKFYGMAGIRTGYAAASPRIISALRTILPPWSVGAASIAAARAVFATAGNFARDHREQTRMRRENLDRLLRTIPEIETIPSEANYILFRWPDAPAGLTDTLLAENSIALRDCSNYRGLEHGPLFRAAVRSGDEASHSAAAGVSVRIRPIVLRRF